MDGDGIPYEHFLFWDPAYFKARFNLSNEKKKTIGVWSFFSGDEISYPIIQKAIIS